MKDIVHVHVISSNATISVKKAQEFVKKLGSNLPDDCFISNIVDNIDNEDDDRTCGDENCAVENDDDANFCKACGKKIPIKNTPDTPIECFNWSGYGSSRTFHSVLVKQIVPHIVGTIHAVALLEGDDDVAPKLLGIMIEDGRYTKCDVEVTLVPQLSHD